MVKLKCTPIVSAPNEYNEFTTDIIGGFFDRKKPTLYGKTSIEKIGNKIDVADEIVVYFSEDIKCSKPYTFYIEMFSFDKSKKLDKDNFLILCEKNTIRFHIKEDKQDEALDFPPQIKLYVSGAEDLVGNMMETMHEGDLISFEFSSENKRSLQEIEMKKGSGCDGLDQDKNGLIDECDEDKTPPSILIHSVPIFSHPKHPNVSFLDSLAFPTVDKAKAFLEDNLQISDDCSNDLSIEISSTEASCDQTKFDVKATNLE